MNIKLKNKFLYFNKYKIKCAIGKRGITSKKIEGDKKHLKVLLHLNQYFIEKIEFQNKITLKKIIIKKIWVGVMI